MSWYLKLHICVWLDMKVPVSAKKQTFEMELHIKTAECCRYLLYIPFWNVRTAAADAVKKRIVDESVAAKTEKTIKISAKADYCGKMVFSLKKCR